MADRLPSLTALRAFEAAARHLSFAKAADELHVTPAALSYQIKSLETELGAPLFRRLNRAVELTEAGTRLSSCATKGFRELTSGWRAAQRQLDDSTLTVTAGPALTAKWLAPRLYEFVHEHPEIELRFSASLQNMDLMRDDVDVAIRFGYGQDEGLYSVPVREEWLTPVMAPALAETYTTPASLQDAPLIFDDSIDFLSPPCNWNAWFRAVGVPHVTTGGAHFSNADHAINAAIAGVGVVLGRRSMFMQDLKDGRLVAPFKCAIQTKARFRFLCLQGAEIRPQIAAFRDWFFAEIDKTAQLSDQFDIIPIEEVPPA